jgi:hypothetical protein
LVSAGPGITQSGKINDIIAALFRAARRLLLSVLDNNRVCYPNQSVNGNLSPRKFKSDRERKVPGSLVTITLEELKQTSRRAVLVNTALNVWGQFGAVANGELKKRGSLISIAGDFYSAFIGRLAVACAERKMC